MTQSLQPPAPEELDKFERIYPNIGRWMRLLTGLFKQNTWREIGDTAGKNPAFENSWVNYEGSPAWETAAFYKDAFGVVHIKGLVKNGTLNTTIFTLPSGCRPSANILFATVDGSAAIRIQIELDGEVKTSGAATNTATGLQLSFRA